MARLRNISSLVEDVIALLATPIAEMPFWESAWDKDRYLPFMDQVQRISVIERAVATLNPMRTTSMEGAYYNPILDLINMPPSFSYKNLLTGESATQAFYHSLFHEL